MTKGIALLWVLLVVAASALAQSTGTIKEVLVRGNTNISRDAIVASMRSQVGRPFIQADLLADEEAIRELGFFKDVKVLSRGVSDTEWQVIVEVEENPVVKEVRIAGNTEVKTEEILPLITQQVGQVFNLRTIDPSAEAIARLYEKKGFFAQADIAPLPESPNTLNVRIIERAVNDIVITGLTRTRPSVIRKLMKTKPGSAFNENRWATDRRRIDSTQWFESVEASSRPTGEIGKFDLLLDVKEARTGLFQFGVALDPRSRLAGSVRFSDSNFRGMGQSLGLELRQDAYGSGLSASIDYINPYMDSRDTSMAVRVYSRVNNYFTGSGLGSVSPTDDRFDERRTGASLSFSRPFREVYNASLGLSYESIRTLSISTTTTQDYIQQDGELLTFSGQLVRDRRDVPLDPAEGDYIRLAVEPAFSNITKVGGNLTGNSDVLGKHTFIRNTIEYKTFFSKRPTDPRRLVDPRSVIAFRARYGVIWGTSPFFEQFFVGGADTLRGYPDQRFWGRNAFNASLEYRYPIQKSFSIVGFADFGGAWGGYGTVNDFTQSNRADLKLGYGAGVAFRTPLGPIRIDFGFNQEGGSRTHFSIGGAF